jgi:prepilin-type N-terminal cleavage/methylation domain-containing protein
MRWNMKKGFTMIELMVVLAVLGVLSAISITMYDDYTKKSKVSEVPLAIKGIVQLQIARKEDPATGNYASDLATIQWLTSKGTATGKFYQFGTSGVEDCDPGDASSLMPIGLAEAWALQPDSVPFDWVTICMDLDFTMLRNSL